MRRRFRQGDRPLAVAVALSLLLHGLIGALALLAPVPAPVAPREGAGVTIELELLPPSSARRVAAAPASPPVSSPPVQRGDRARIPSHRAPERGPERPPGAGGAPQPLAGIPVPAAPSEDPAGELAGDFVLGPATAGPAGAAGGAAANPGPGEAPDPGAPYRALVLTPRPQHEDGPAAPAPPPPTDADLEARLSARIDGFVEGKQARDRAERPDAYWLDLRERLASDFSPDAELLRTGPTTGALPGLDKAVRGWLADAERYGRTGAPWEEDPVTRERARDGQGVGDPPESVHGVWLHGLSATVVLLQDEEGRVLSIELDRSSGNTIYDRQALAAVQSLALEKVELGRPPQARRTVWSFESELVIIPPAPIVGCSFDATFGPVECYYPLKQLLRSRVRLLAVHAG